MKISKRMSRGLAVCLACVLLSLPVSNYFIIRTAQAAETGQTEPLSQQSVSEDAESKQESEPKRMSSQPETKAKSLDLETEEKLPESGTEVKSEPEPETEDKTLEQETEARPSESETEGKPSEPETEAKPSESEPETEARPSESEPEGKPSEPETETEGKPSEPETETRPLESETEGKLPESETEEKAELETFTEEESETETEFESETEAKETESDRFADFDAGWQNGPLVRAGMKYGRSARMAHPTVWRDDSLIVSYLDYPAYFKYVTNHGLDAGGKTVAAYCVYNPLEAPDDVVYVPSGTGAFSREITYCLYNGCRYRGKTAHNPKYSMGDWKKDYYITQVAIHLINAQQGRESSIEPQLNKSKNKKLYSMICSMVEDAYADTTLTSSVTNQTKEVTYQASPASQDQWIRQKDGSWRTASDYTCISNAPRRIQDVSRRLEAAVPQGTSVVVRDKGDLFSPFYLTATPEAYRKIAKDQLTVRVLLGATAVEYGGWWYKPASSSVKRQYVTYLSLEETQTQQDMGSVSATAYGIYFDVRLLKRDASSKETLKGAVYGLYRDPECRSLVAEFPATGADGGTQLTEIAAEQSAYYVREISPPAGYCRNPQVYTVSPEQNQSTVLNVEDKEQKGRIVLYKEGEVLTAAQQTEDGISFQYTRKRIPGAVFELRAAAPVYSAAGKLIWQKDEVVRSSLVTNADGEAFADELPMGRYYLVEKQTPPSLVLSGNRWEVTLTPQNDTAELTSAEVKVTNDRQKARVSTYKQEEQTKKPLRGAVFGLYAAEKITLPDGKQAAAEGDLLARATTDERGKADFAVDLPVGFTYEIREIKAPWGYAFNGNWKYSFAFLNHTAEAVRAFSGTCTNRRCEGKLTLQKLDSDTSLDVPQGDGSLAGAVYGLYAREQIVHPDQTSGVVLEKDAQAAVLETDERGRASADGLYPGRYYLKELKPPQGYVRDEAEHDLEFTWENGAELQIVREVQIKEQVKKQGFQLLKASENGEDAPPALQGAGFMAWLVSELKQNEDGSYAVEDADPVVLGPEGETELFTDENGYLCTIPLPYGVYLVRETTVPENHRPVRDFFVTISEHSPQKPQPWMILLDEQFQARLKIIKKDADSGHSVLRAGAEFKVFNLDKQEYVVQSTTYPEHAVHESFFTNEEGYLMLPEPLVPGHYRIEEITAPEGYQQNETPVELTISADSAHRVDPDSGDLVLEAEYFNESAKGRITVYKTGEVLDAYDGQFHYTEVPLEGVTFEVIAEEEIRTPDGAEGAEGLLYAKGTVVTEMTTDKNGDAQTEKLPLGTYRVREKQPPHGFLADSQGKVVTLSRKDQDTPVSSKHLTFYNKRQKLRIQVKKKDAHSEQRLAGAQFGLYTKEEIKNAQGVCIAAAGMKVDTCTTDENGIGLFRADLPPGVYVVKEEKAPEGFLLTDLVQEVDLREPDPETELTEQEFLFVNERVPETETESETESEQETETESETESEQETETESEAESEQETKSPIRNDMSGGPRTGDDTNIFGNILAAVLAGAAIAVLWFGRRRMHRR